MEKTDLLVIHHYEDWGIYYTDDIVLLDYLKKQFNVHILDWRKMNITELKNKIVLIRHPFEYYKNINIFLDLIESIEKIALKLFNSSSLIRANSNKAYLFDLAQIGINIVPSVKIDSVEDYSEISHIQSPEIIIKPQVGESSYGIKKLTKTELSKELIDQNIKLYGGILIQEFLPSIYLGETSLIFIHGEYSHSVLKKPRRQGEYLMYWDNYEQVHPSQDLINQCIRIINSYSNVPSYARLDWIRYRNKYYLLEVDLIDPVFYITKIDKKTQSKFLESFYQMLNRK